MTYRLIGLCLFAVGLLAPNLLWLTHSTSRIKNEGTAALNSVTVQINGQQMILGDLQPGQSRFMVLPDVGSGTYSLRYFLGNRLKIACREYVEDDMFHIEVRIFSSGEAQCDPQIPVFSEFLLSKLL